MSIERKLLNLCAVTLYHRDICPDLLKDIQELLAQPEHIVDVTDMVEPELEQSNKWWYEKGVEDTKYFLTRKPLSKEQYMKFFTDTYDSVNPITDFVRAIEKAHGITGVNNNE